MREAELSSVEMQLRLELWALYLHRQLEVDRV